MTSIKVRLNDELVFNPSQTLLEEKGFLVNVQSKMGIPLGSENNKQEITLQIHKKDISEDLPPALDIHQLEVGDKITIWGEWS